jgi:hypothetical protein
MSITTEIRAYADKAIDRATDTATIVAGRATGAVAELQARASGVQTKTTELVGELRSVNLDVLKSRVETYLKQLDGCRATLQHQVQDQVRTLGRHVPGRSSATAPVEKAPSGSPSTEAAPSTPVTPSVEPTAAAPAKATAKATKAAAKATKPAARKAPAKKTAKSV